MQIEEFDILYKGTKPLYLKNEKENILFGDIFDIQSCYVHMNIGWKKFANMDS